jgi:ABC-type dipeptide/oligopeptide/nickel transport system permease component
MKALRSIANRVGARLLSSIPALLGVLVLTFLLMRVLPGDPAIFFASGPNAGQAEICVSRWGSISRSRSSWGAICSMSGPVISAGR